MAIVVITLLGLVGYLIGGYILISANIIDLPYRFLTTDTDPVFNFLAAVIGLSIVIANLALVFLALISGESENEIIIQILFSSIAIGFGAVVLRFTLPIVIESFI